MRCAVVVRVAAAVFCAAAAAASPATDLGPFELYGQATYIRQFKPAFPAAYSGPNSLSPERANSYSLTGTAFVGTNLGRGWEAYINPELAQGVSFSELRGLGGFSNGELARTSGPQVTAYMARAFVRKTWNLSGELEDVASEANQVKTRYAAQRVVLTAGKVSVLDVFDGIDYSNDPRTRFMNWSSLTYGAWDYPADARGYTWGAALEYIDGRFAARAGRFAVPVESNGLQLDSDIANHYGDVVELEMGYDAPVGAGIVRLLAFRNQAVMGRFRDALAYAEQFGGTPSVANVRELNTKYGFGASVQQAIGPYLGAYARLGWNNGQTETYMFTEIDRSIAAGVVLSGGQWSRAQDNLGVALYQNMLGSAHRDYLAAGGLGFFLGDGALNYAPERIIEVFYALGVVRGLTVSAGYQHVLNPGYNRDRGPVDFFGFRIHAAI